MYLQQTRLLRWKCCICKYYSFRKLIGETGIVSEDNFENALYKILSQSKHHLIPAEMEALKYGVEYKE